MFINEIKPIIKNLINQYPIFAQEGVQKAQTIVQHYLQNNGWEVLVDVFTASDIVSDPLYVNVDAFGGIYQSYSTVQKTNVYGILRSNRPGPTLILNGHIDVDILDSNNMHQTYHIQEQKKNIEDENEVIRGRGATDMLSGLTAMMVVASHFVRDSKDWRGNIILCSVCDEEIGGNGTLRSLHFLRDQGLIESGNTFCIIAEPSNNLPCLESLGFMNLYFSFNRNSIHMGVAKRINNTIYDMINVVDNFEKILSEAVGNAGYPFDNMRFLHNFGSVNGGTDAAIPIQKLELKSTIFHPECIENQILFQSLKEHIRNDDIVKIMRDGISFPGAKFETFELYSALNSNISAHHSLFPSPCDARLYKAFGIPAIVYGPGSLSEAHSKDEYIEIKAIESYTNQLYQGLTRYYG